MKNKCRAGTTLVEVLIAAAILAIITTAIVSIFAAGVKVYNRMQSYDKGEIDVLLSLEKLERDLRNALDYSGIYFNGKRDEVSFAGLLDGMVGMVYYYLDRQKDVLIREWQGYPQGISGIRKKKGKVSILAHIEDIDFMYYYFNEESQECEWKSSWILRQDRRGEEAVEEEVKEVRIPLGVKFEVKFKDEGRDVTLVRKVFIPSSSRKKR